MGKVDKKAVCIRIREAREAKGLTLAEMADVLELHPNTWGRYERDTVPWKYLRQVSETLGVSVGWLVRGEVDEAELLRELARTATTQTQALEAALAELARMNANLEKLQGSLLPNGERYRGRGDRDVPSSGGASLPSTAFARGSRD